MCASDPPLRLGWPANRCGVSLPRMRAAEVVSLYTHPAVAPAQSSIPRSRDNRPVGEPLQNRLAQLELSECLVREKLAHLSTTAHQFHRIDITTETRIASTSNARTEGNSTGPGNTPVCSPEANATKEMSEIHCLPHPAAKFKRGSFPRPLLSTAVK